jgi:uncharacterized membrane protein
MTEPSDMWEAEQQRRAEAEQRRLAFRRERRRIERRLYLLFGLLFLGFAWLLYTLVMGVKGLILR